jgi:serine/threonine-protein kinase RsbW
MQIRELDLLLHNDGLEIPRLASTLEYFAEMGNIPSKALFRLNLALDELLTNVISYGYPEPRLGEIGVRVRYDGNRIEVRLADDALAFDPFSVPEPDTTSNTEDRPIGGLGVHFVRTLMDEVSYCREGRQNVVTIALNVPAATQAANGR